VKYKFPVIYKDFTEMYTYIKLYLTITKECYQINCTHFWYWVHISKKIKSFWMLYSYFV